MWSRKASPVETRILPRPSRSTFAVSCVSLLLRTTCACLLKPDLDRVGVRAEAFHLGQPYARFSQRFQVAAVQAQNAGPLEKGVNAERRPIHGCAGRG